MAQTHQDTNVNQLVINKMTKQEYDNLQQVSETELYLVEEQVDSVVTQNSTNPVQSGAVYEALQQSSSNIKELVDNLIIANNFAYPLEGTYIGQVESTEPPIFYDRKAADFHTFVSQDNGKYFYDDIDNKVYIYIEQPNQHLYCVSDNELYYLENLDTTKTYLSYKTDKLYRTNNGENFNLIATTDYIDLKNKPLSVENSKVKYTLSDGTTKLTLAQEGDLKTVAFSGSYNDLTDKLQNATTGAAGLMSAEDKSKSDKYIYTRITLSPTSGESFESGFKRFITELTTAYPSLADKTIFQCRLSFYNEIVVNGGAYDVATAANVDGHYYYCNFIAIRLLANANKIYQFGWSGTEWYYREI